MWVQIWWNDEQYEIIQCHLYNITQNLYICHCLLWYNDGTFTVTLNNVKYASHIYLVVAGPLTDWHHFQLGELVYNTPLACLMGLFLKHPWQHYWVSHPFQSTLFFFCYKAAVYSVYQISTRSLKNLCTYAASHVWSVSLQNIAYPCKSNTTRLGLI